MHQTAVQQINNFLDNFIVMPVHNGYIVFTIFIFLSSTKNKIASSQLIYISNTLLLLGSTIGFLSIIIKMFSYTKVDKFNLYMFFPLFLPFVRLLIILKLFIKKVNRYKTNRTLYFLIFNLAFTATSIGILTFVLSKSGNNIDVLTEYIWNTSILKWLLTYLGLLIAGYFLFPRIFEVKNDDEIVKHLVE